MTPVFFPTAAEFRRWLRQNHERATEVQVGFFKKAARKPGMSYAEAVEEALCFGWIDSVMHPLDAERYAQRFSPRRRGSIWSNTNVAHVGRLTAAGRMEPAGQAAFAARSAQRTGVYSFEAATPKSLSAADTRRLRATPAAWKFFSAQAPWYRRKVAWWIVSAKRPETRERRLAKLIAASAAGKQI